MQEKSGIHQETFVRVNRAVCSPGSPFELEMREDKIMVKVWTAEREADVEPKIDISEHHLNIHFPERRLVINMLRGIRPDALEVERRPDCLLLRLEPFDEQVHPTLILDDDEGPGDDSGPTVETPRARVRG